MQPDDYLPEDLTEWFNGNTPPVNPGVYRRRRVGDEDFVYAKFNGEEWKRGSASMIHASQETEPAGMQLSAVTEWQGLAEKPDRTVVAVPSDSDEDEL